MSLQTLPALVKKDKNRKLGDLLRERIWLHGDELAKFEDEHGQAQDSADGRAVRAEVSAWN